MAARAMRSLALEGLPGEIDTGDQHEDTAQQQQQQHPLRPILLMMGAAGAQRGALASSLSVSETSEEAESDKGGWGSCEKSPVQDPEKAMQEAWQPDDAEMDDFPVFCDETQSAYHATEPIHALHGLPLPLKKADPHSPPPPSGC